MDKEIGGQDAPPPAQLGRGTRQTGVRLYNERLVLSLIRLHGNLPKAEVAKLTGLSAQTVSVIIRQLEADGLLAICIQHELDHLDGKLFVDYLSELKRTRIRKKLEKDKRNRPATVEGVRTPAL